MRTLVEYLRRGYAVLQDRRNWTRGAFARDDEGREVDVTRVEAARTHCVYGAPLAALAADLAGEHGADAQWPGFDAMERRIVWAIDRSAMRLFGPTKTGSRVNDWHGHAAALRVLADAIACEGGAEGDRWG